MRRWRWLLLLAVVTVSVLALWAVAAGQRKPGGGPMVAGSGYYRFSMVGPLTGEGYEITDCAFAANASEVAFCGPHDDGSALWVTSMDPLLADQKRLLALNGKLHRELTPADMERLQRPYPEGSGRPRLLFSSQAGVVLGGPILWAPNGATVLVRARQGEATDLVAVDYLSGAATWLTHGARVEEAAWATTGGALAYVTREEGARVVWLQRALKGEPTRVGVGGYDLRWASDGRRLRWLAPVSATTWQVTEWSADTGQVSRADPRPARPEGTVWSPDGRWCAWLESAGGLSGKKLLLAPADSAGAEVPLPDVHPTRLLGWSPDSQLLLVSDGGGHLFAVNANPPGPDAVATEGAESETSVTPVRIGRQRAQQVTEFPSRPLAGSPTWSADGAWLVFPAAEAASWGMPEPFTRRFGGLSGRLLLFGVTRTPVHIYPARTPELERAAARSQMAQIAMALQIYMTDYDRWPTSADQATAMAALEEYVRSQDVFMRPWTEDQPVVQWHFEPGTAGKPGDSPATTVVATFDYSGDFTAIGYADGHVEVRGRR